MPEHVIDTSHDDHPPYHELLSRTIRENLCREVSGVMDLGPRGGTQMWVCLKPLPCEDHDAPGA